MQTFLERLRFRHESCRWREPVSTLRITRSFHRIVTFKNTLLSFPASPAKSISPDIELPYDEAPLPSPEFKRRPCASLKVNDKYKDYTTCLNSSWEQLNGQSLNELESCLYVALKAQPRSSLLPDSDTEFEGEFEPEMLEPPQESKCVECVRESSKRLN